MFIIAKKREREKERKRKKGKKQAPLRKTGQLLAPETGASEHTAPFTWCPVPGTKISGGTQAASVPPDHARIRTDRVQFLSNGGSFFRCESWTRPRRPSRQGRNLSDALGCTV